MSRPPRPRTRWSTTGSPAPGGRRMDYFPEEFADLLELERGLASGELGLPAESAEGDVAGTLMELSALVAHVLGLYQDRYAGEAFLGTARSPRSLVRHGRRLGYEPAPAVAATGYLQLVAKEGPAGRVPAGFAVSSSPVGEKKAQDYETLADVDVDPRWNAMPPRDARKHWGSEAPPSLEVPGLGLGIAAGDVIVLETVAAAPTRHVREVGAVDEDPARKVTLLTTKTDLPVISTAKVRLYARPKTRAHLFGRDTSAADFTNTQLRTTVVGPPAPTSSNPVRVGWTVTPDHNANEVYLAEELKKDLAGSLAVRITAGSQAALVIASTRAVHVTLKKVALVEVTIPPASGSGAGTTLRTTPTVSVSRAVTGLRFTPEVARANQSPRTSVWLLDWQVQVELDWDRPNPDPVSEQVVLAGAVEGLAPGQLAAFSTTRTVPAATEVVRLVRVESDATSTTVWWAPVDPVTGGRAWTLGDLVIQGNVVGASHGRSVTEVLGDSDGVTALLRFALKQKPVTYLPSVEGAEPALEVRVADVRWTRVADFEASGPHDRHYLVQRAEDGTVTVLFGDGRKGAVPPSGRKHVVARYRVGAGVDGNAPAGVITRVQKAHPLVERVTQPMPFLGGTDAARAEDVRTQATRYVRTFDRAVSVEDHADLALLFPGIVKARAAWGPLPDRAVEGVLLIVADATGAPPNLDERDSRFKKFLRARRDNTVPLHVGGPRVVRLHARIQVDHDPAFEREAVLQAVRDVLCAERAEAPGLFSFAGRDLGSPAFLSEVYARVEPVPGVTLVQVWHLATAAPAATPALHDTIVVQPDEWIRLDPSDLRFDPAPRSTP